jgi:hypothetical protein
MTRNVQTTLLGEALAAQVALVGSLTGVDTEVYLQAGWVGEYLVAHITLVNASGRSGLSFPLLNRGLLLLFQI